MIKERRSTVEMSLSVNFRSDLNIVSNSNQFSSLKARANSQEQGFVDTQVMHTFDELIEVMKFPEEVAILVRTNDIIKKLEIVMLPYYIDVLIAYFVVRTPGVSVIYTFQLELNIGLISFAFVPDIP